MPHICEFFGIVIYMYYNDHSPAHFHAEYAEREATFTIDTLEVLEGELPRRPRAFVIEWASLHREELERIGTVQDKVFRLIASNHWNDGKESPYASSVRSAPSNL